MRSRQSKGKSRFAATHRPRLLATLIAAVALLIPLTPISAGAAPLLDLGELAENLGIAKSSGAPAPSARPDFVEGELLVRFDPASGAPERAQVRARRGLQKVGDLPLPGLELVRIPGARNIPDHARGVASEKSVLYAEPNFVASTAQTSNDPYFSYLWGLDNSGQSVFGLIGLDDADIDGPEAWSLGGSSTPVVAVADSGVDTNHPDLAANIWINPGEAGAKAGNGIDDDNNGYVDDVHGWDFFNGDNSVFDSGEVTHGTHVAGTIAATRGNGMGVAGVSQAKVMSLKFLGPDGSGTLSGALYAIDYAVRNGAAVSNHSWTSGGYSQSLAEMVAWAGSQGHLIVAAAGNQGSSLESSPAYPASFTAANVVSVAATDNNDRLASFSNYGNTSVDLGAPGVGILSTVPGNGYAYMSGTSMATPHVAGAAAHLLTRFPDMDPAELKAALLEHGDAVSALAGITVTGRRLNLAGALQAAAASQVSTATSAFQPLTPARILDTRPSAQIGYTGSTPAALSTVELQVTGRGGVPASGVSAVVMNLTATGTSAVGYLTVWPTGGPRPLASNLNLEYAGQTLGNLVVVPVGDDGKVSIFTVSQTHMVADVAGYFQPAETARAGRQRPLTPTRLLDTRPDVLNGYAGDKPADGSTTTLQVTGRGGVPASGVSAVVLNVTATQTTKPSYVTVWPSHLSRPRASNLNPASANQTIGNSVIVPVSPNGQVSLFTTGSTHLVADVFGYYTDGTAPEDSSGLFVPATPTRLLDTRSNGPQVGYSGPTPADGSTVELNLAGRAPIPASGVGSVVMNLTSAYSAGPSYITVWPAGQNRPLVSNLNPERAGQVIGNLVTSPVSSAGAVNLYSVRSGHLIADVAGYYTE